MTNNVKGKSYLRILPSVEHLSVDISNSDTQVSIKEDPNCCANFTKVFYDLSQRVICETIIKGIANKCIEGTNYLIISYGQKGAGKTFTCFGTNYGDINYGLAPRIIRNILTSVSSKQKRVSIQFFECNMKRKKDLLLNSPQNLSKRCDSDNMVKIDITSVDEAVECINIGLRSRVFKSDIYGCSHTNDSVFRIIVFDPNTRVNSIIHIIDLAYLHPPDSKTLSAPNLQIQQISALINSGQTYFNSVLLNIITSTMSSNPSLITIGHVIAVDTHLNILRIVIKAARKLSPQKARKDSCIVSMSYSTCEIVQSKNPELIENFQSEERLQSQHRFQQITETISEYLQNKRTKEDTLSILNFDAALDAFKSLFINIVNENQQLQNELSLLKRSDFQEIDKCVSVDKKTKSKFTTSNLEGSVLKTKTREPSVSKQGSLLLEGITIGPKAFAQARESIFKHRFPKMRSIELQSTYLDDKISVATKSDEKCLIEHRSYLMNLTAANQLCQDLKSFKEQIDYSILGGNQRCAESHMDKIKTKIEFLHDQIEQYRDFISNAHQELVRINESRHDNDKIYLRAVEPC